MGKRHKREQCTGRSARLPASTIASQATNCAGDRRIAHHFDFLHGLRIDILTS